MAFGAQLSVVSLNNMRAPMQMKKELTHKYKNNCVMCIKESSMIMLACKTSSISSMIADVHFISSFLLPA